MYHLKLSLLILRNSRSSAVAVRSKAWVFGRSLARIVGSNPNEGHGCLSLVSVVCCCQVEASATSRSFVQKSPTDRGVSFSVIKRN
jgi:hypothetical protein